MGLGPARARGAVGGRTGVELIFSIVRTAEPRTGVAGIEVVIEAVVAVAMTRVLVSVAIVAVALARVVPTGSAWVLISMR